MPLPSQFVVEARYSGSALSEASTGRVSQRVEYGLPAFASPATGSTVVGGTVVPLRFTLTDSAGRPLSDLASTVLARKIFTPVERENGKAAWLLGASFISEGAIPFAAADPLRVIPASMVGGAVTGALCMVFNVQSYAPHGGIFVLFAIAPIWGFLLALAAGTLVSAFLVVAFKRFIAPKELEAAEENLPAVAVPA